MLAILYLCVCAITGMVLVAICVPDVRRLYLACAPSVKAIENIPSTLFVVATGTTAGLMVVPFVNYYVILGLSYFIASDKLCMKISFMVTAALFLWLVLTCLILVNRRRIKKDEEGDTGFVKLPGYVNKPSNTIFYSIIILLITITASFLMFYTYRIDRGYLLNGYSTFSDLSPHTAMVSSFGKGFNFPTQYMHYSGDGIKYHFLFYFLAGMLEYLGFPIDYALNIPSIITMVCAMILLGLIAVLLSGRRLAFALSPVLVFLRSSLNVFIHIGKLMSEGNSVVDSIGTVMSEASWYAATPYDDWGLWAINVYPNQRHLMLGISVILVAVILFMPFVRRLCISVMSAGSFGGGIKAFLFSRNAWLPRKDDPLSAGTITLLTCLLVIVMPYFHGSCLIALLLVLFGMALISESRLLHLLVAVSAVCSSCIQTFALSGGASNVINLKFAPGFIYNDDATVISSEFLLKLGGYLLTVTGATLVVALLCSVILLIHDIVKKKPVYRFFLFLAFLNPLIFAFTFQVSLEMLANHKFIQVTLILVDVFVAIFLANLFVVPGRRKATAALAADADVEAVADTESEELVAVSDTEALEAAAVKAEKDGELPPVITKEETDAEKLESAEIPEEEPFEILEDSEETDKDKDKDDGKEKATAEGTADDESVKPASEDVLDDSDDADVALDDRILEKFPSETSVSMRPGNIIHDTNKEEVSDKEDAPSAEEDSDKAAEEAETAEKPAEPDNSIPKEDTVAMRPGNLVNEIKAEESSDKADEPSAEEDTAGTETEDKDGSEDAEKASDDKKPDDTETVSGDKETGKEEAEEETKETAETSETDGEDDDLPFEVLDDDEGSDSKGSDDDSAKASEEDSDKDGDEEEPVLEHNEIVPEKAKGLPGPVWVIFEIFGVAAALILLVGLVGTGISEWATYININSTPMAVNTNSPATEWILKNTEPDDVFLTPEWSMNRFLLTGRPMYYGWPYYAWSAGHDTETRDKIYVWLITGCGGDINEFKRYCKERGIRYLIADPEFDDGDYGEGVYFNLEFFEKNLTQVAYFSEESTVIYKIY